MEAANPLGTPIVELGCQRLAADPGAWQNLGPRLGLLTNDGARAGPIASLPRRDGDENDPPRNTLDPSALSRVELLKAGLPLTRLFAPEHGLSALAPDGVALPDGTDGSTGLPVTSLYGARLRPDPGTLDELDTVLVDLPDVGARFYTFLWTLTHLMEACTQAGLPVVILDRPNPLGGLESWVEGPLPDPDTGFTFLGRWPVPVRHSLTLGEMALLIRGEMQLPLKLEVIPMQGWKRAMLWRDTGHAFHPPSPGIPTPESALLYPGLALLEATNVSEGRGTHLSFQWLGAPWMEEGRGVQALADHLNRSTVAGVRGVPHTLTIPEGDEPCPGVLLEITEPRQLRPFYLGLRLLSLLPTLWPRRFRWTPYPTAVNPSGRGHLLRLLARRDMVDTLKRVPGDLDDRTLLGWTAAPGWWDRAAPYLLYE